jgi:hypothetical protein
MEEETEDTAEPVSSIEEDPVEHQVAEDPPITSVTPIASVTTADTPMSPETPEPIPGSWPTVDPIPTLPAATEADDSDTSSGGNHVNDRIANQFAELERETQAAAITGLGLGAVGESFSQVTASNWSQGPMILNRTELTPIMESSPRESMASDIEPATVPRILTLKTRPSDDSGMMRDLYGKSPPSQHSHTLSVNGPTSPAVSIKSLSRSRSSSLSSQAERLRNKFMQKSSPERTIDAEYIDPTKVEKRRKFESLIRSGETMKLTLTPNSLRSIEVRLR